jgi:hypothetical protein
MSLVLLLALACGSPSASVGVAPANELDGPPAPTTLPWTDAFIEPALLMADEVRIEGPPGLITHFVGRVEEGITRTVKTLPEGLRQVYVVDAGAHVEVRAQLDQLQIVALRSIVVLERPGPVDVVVDARGDVFHQAPGGEVRRSPSLRLEGPLRR